MRKAYLSASETQVVNIDPSEGRSRYSDYFSVQQALVEYHLFDLTDRRALARPLTIYGINAITVFVGSGILAKTLIYLKVGEVSLHNWLYEGLLASWLPPYVASLGWAVIWVVGWFCVLAWMARRGVVIKV